MMTTIFELVEVKAQEVAMGRPTRNTVAIEVNVLQKKKRQAL